MSFLLFAILLAGTASTTTPVPALATSPVPAPDAQADIRAMITAQSDAWNRGDLKAFLASYWDSDELTFFSNGTVSKGFSALAARYQKRYGNSKDTMGHLDFTDLDVTMLGAQAAAVRGRFQLKMKDGTEPTGIFTLLVRQIKGHWVIIHDHTSTDTK